MIIDIVQIGITSLIERFLLISLQQISMFLFYLYFLLNINAEAFTYETPLYRP
jgi:hypothetical protein